MHRCPARRVAGLLAGLLLAGCAAEAPAPRSAPPVEKPFTRLPAAYTGLAFENTLTDTREVNVFTYRNYYDGGGVGLADLNGDGLVDVYLTANQRPNRLFLNRGDFRFEDVTEAAGVAGRHRWSTGISIADVDGNGWPDLYVCNSGDYAGDDRANELFLNQGPDADGIPRFTEHAAALGLADPGYSTHAAFFDYDRDGDLDVYVMNNSSRPIPSFTVQNVRHVRHELGGDRLYRHDDDGFTDVTEAAGLYSSEIGFGLGVTAGDVDGDGWVDLYLSNDFFERDYLYLNNHDGTFREVIEQAMPHISQSSMGADMADLDNDGFPEIYVTDMLPEDDFRLKTTSTFDTPAAYAGGLQNDFHHQLMRNTLQHNNGDGTFSEVALMAGVAATDWSWGALLADFDNDGLKDIFVANGVYKDLTDQDFIASFSSRRSIRDFVAREGLNYPKLLARIGSTPLPNYLFHNDGDLSFSNRAAAWGLDTPSWSNGAAYGDLDNDGDLDLVVNNVNQEAFVYRNEADTLTTNRSVQVALEGEGLNRTAIGARVWVYAGGQRFYQELMPTRGFQSSVDPVLTFGLGPAAGADSVVVAWPDGRLTRHGAVAAGARLALRQVDAGPGPLPPAPAPDPRFTDVTAALALPWAHHENAFEDFDREPMLPWRLSTDGPAFATADVDGDGRADLFLGGAKESPGTLLRQRPDGRFEPTNRAVFAADAIAEDVDAAFFDADGDGDADLYVVSGGNEYAHRAPGLEDRLYLNDGHGGFTRTYDRLPPRYQSGSAVAPADYDGDGDVDLFVGSRSVPWRYGEVPESVLLRNDGRGHFAPVPEADAPGLARAGLLTDAAWADVDGDGRPDLLLAGEWMPLTVYHNEGGGRLVRARDNGLDRTEGLWRSLLPADLDGDGDLDLVAGNLGLNSRLRAAEAEPLTLHVADFDRNGWVEQILSVYHDGVALPMILRRDLVAQLPFVAERFPTHAAYAGKTVEDLFTAEERARATVHHARTLASTIFLNRGDGTFTAHPLPRAAQVAPVMAALADDVDGDGAVDLLLAGNFFGFKPDLGRLDASYGLYLRGDGQGGFTPVPARRSGFRLTGEARALGVVPVARRGRTLFVVKNDAPVQVFRY